MRVTDIDALMERLEITDECENCKWGDGMFCEKGSDFVDACEAICEAPTYEITLFSEAVPSPSKNLIEVVRCKDCKYNLKNPRDYYDDDLILCFAWCPLISHLSEGEGWCFRGKRKDELQMETQTETQNSNLTFEKADERCKGCKHYKLTCDLFSEICKYEPKTESFDKDINVRSKDEPQTETEIAKAIVHKMIDDAVIAEDAYPDLRQKMHDAVDEYEPQTERSSE